MFFKPSKENSILFFVSILFSLIFSEVFLRIIEPQRFSHPSGLFVKDIENGFLLKNNFKVYHKFPDHTYLIKTNSFGCFEKEINPKLVNILILGDSHTFGYVSENKRFSNLLKEKHNLNVYNCAIPGSGTLHQTNNFKRLLKKGFNPKIIILGYLPFNDPEDDALHPRYSAWNGEKFLIKEFGKSGNGNVNFLNIVNYEITNKRKLKSLIYNNLAIIRYFYILQNKLNKTNYKNQLVNNFNDRFMLTQKNNRRFIDENIKNIKELDQIIKDNKSKLLLVNIPLRDKDCREDYIKNTKYIFEKLNKSKVKIISSRICMPDKYFHKIDGHLNNYGHELISSDISNYLIKSKLKYRINERSNH